MDKATELIQPEERLKLSRIPSSSFSIENLIATEHRHIRGHSPPVSDRSGPVPGDASPYLVNGYNAAMLSFTNFPLYNPWVGYLSQTANEKLSQLFSSATSGGGGDKRVHKSVPSEPGEAGPGPANSRDEAGSGGQSGDKSSIEVNALKTFPGVAAYGAAPNLEVAAQYFANTRRSLYPADFGESGDKINHSSYGGGGGGGGVSSAIGGRIFLRNFNGDLASAASRSSLDIQDSDSRQSYLNIDRDDDEQPAGDGGGDSNDDGSYSDDISLSLSPTGCGKSTGKDQKGMWYTYRSGRGNE